MRIPRIHTSQGLHSGLEVELEPGPARHVARVLRMGPGDSLTLFNGDGAEYPAIITHSTGKRLVVTVNEIRERDLEAPLAVHLGIGMSRGERMDQVIQKGTELGVAHITPLFTERSELKLDAARLEKKCRHWRRVAISACEQCGRNRVPPVAEPRRLEGWLQGIDISCRLVLHPGGNALHTLVENTPDNVALLVGPEGGLSGAEVEQARLAGFDVWGLGPRTLRTETAPLAALAVLQAYWGDL